MFVVVGDFAGALSNFSRLRCEYGLAIRAVVANLYCIVCGFGEYVHCATNSSNALPMGNIWRCYSIYLFFEMTFFAVLRVIYVLIIHTLY